jgi:hypothetical protein
MRYRMNSLEALKVQALRAAGREGQLQRAIIKAT